MTFFLAKDFGNAKNATRTPHGFRKYSTRTVQGSAKPHKTQQCSHTLPPNFRMTPPDSMLPTGTTMDQIPSPQRVRVHTRSICHTQSNADCETLTVVLSVCRSSDLRIFVLCVFVKATPYFLRSHTVSELHHPMVEFEVGPHSGSSRGHAGNEELLSSVCGLCNRTAFIENPCTRNTLRNNSASRTSQPVCRTRSATSACRPSEKR